MLLAICAGNLPVPGEFPTQRPVTRSFDVLFDLRLNKRLSKQSCGWWFETSSCPLWRHRNGDVIAHPCRTPMFIHLNYRQTASISRTKSTLLNVSRLIFQLSLPIHLNQVLSQEWRCIWSSAGRRNSNYIRGINSFIAGIRPRIY